MMTRIEINAKHWSTPLVLSYAQLVARYGELRASELWDKVEEKFFLVEDDFTYTSIG